MNSSSLHAWEVEKYSCPCKRLTDKRRQRIRETQTRRRAWKVITCLNSFGKKRLSGRSGAWTSVSPLRTKSFFLCCDGTDQKNSIIYKSYSRRYARTHAPPPWRWELIWIRLQLTWAVIRTANPAQIRLVFFPRDQKRYCTFHCKEFVFSFPTLVHYNDWENTRFSRGKTIFRPFSGAAKSRKYLKCLENWSGDFFLGGGGLLFGFFLTE